MEKRVIIAYQRQTNANTHREYSEKCLAKDIWKFFRVKCSSLHNSYIQPNISHTKANDRSVNVVDGKSREDER